MYMYANNRRATFQSKNDRKITHRLSPIAAAFAAILLAIMITGCQKRDQLVGHPNGRLKVVTTTGMIADIAVNIGGDRVYVKSLMGPGIDPHLYRASHGDIALLSQADIIFYNGLHLEGQMGEVFEQMRSKIPTVAVAQAIDTSLLLSSLNFAGVHDPHVWFDVKLWIKACESVRDHLCRFDSSGSGYYIEKSDKYIADLLALDAYIRQTAQTLPDSARVLITAHDAFQYFGRAYGFQVMGLQGISTAAEAGTADVMRLADFIAGRKIKAIFIESSVPRRNIEAVQAAVRARGFDVQIGGTLYSDALGNPDTPEGTYIGMFKYNIDTIMKALR